MWLVVGGKRGHRRTAYHARPWSSTLGLCALQQVHTTGPAAASVGVNYPLNHLLPYYGSWAPYPSERAHRRGPPKSTADFPSNGTLAGGICSLHLHAYQSLNPPLNSCRLQSSHESVVYRYGFCCCKLKQLLVACSLCSLVTRLCFKSMSLLLQLQQSAIFRAANCSTTVNFLGMVHASSCPQLGLHALKPRPVGQSST